MGKISYFDNRELSWLKFNQRVLEEAEDKRVPLFERLRFVSIFSSNLDEFFMVRVGSLYDQTLLKKDKPDNKTGLTSAQQLSLISEKVTELMPRFDEAYRSITGELKEYGAEHVRTDSLSEADREFLHGYFLSDIKPLLFPSVIDKKHPIPFFANKAIYIYVKLQGKKGGEIWGLIPSGSDVFGRVVFLPSENGFRFILTEELILLFAEDAFSGYTVTDKGILRITRNADIDANEALFDYDVDFRDVMEEVVKKRRKLCPVRIEYTDYKNASDIDAFAEKAGLSIGNNFIFKVNHPLDFGFLGEIEDKLSGRPELFFNKLVPQPSPSIVQGKSMLSQIDEKDILLMYPYEAFSPFINLLDEAASSPDVVSIKITLYRVARDSKIVDALIKAAENGKDVLALVELRARFDEENNIGWSKRLEEAGVTVIYGLDNLKVHSKLLLITRKKGNSIYYTTQIGTGNYNERTSKLYTDITLMTADQDIGTDASLVFSALSIGSTVESSSSLWVAPNCLKPRVVELIDREITYGKDGYVGLKLNSLTDKDIIEKLRQASKAGVKIELLIRGISCLVSGIEGETENITLISIVGRFLEHSRIYIFGKGDREKMYISSADFMTRNTERRVEVAAPIKDKEIRARLLDYFNTCFKDDFKVRVQQSDGTYIRREPSDEPLNSQIYFYEKAYSDAKKAKNTPVTEKKPKLVARIRKIKKQ